MRRRHHRRRSWRGGPAAPHGQLSRRPPSWGRKACLLCCCCPVRPLLFGADRRRILLAMGMNVPSPLRLQQSKEKWASACEGLRLEKKSPGTEDGNHAHLLLTTSNLKHRAPRGAIPQAAAAAAVPRREHTGKQGQAGAGGMATRAAESLAALSNAAVIHVSVSL
jgi:hypothetical protein